MTIFIEKNQMKDINLLKANRDNFLFIPLNIIRRILHSGFREILNADEINKQFADLAVRYQFGTDGFIVPMGYSNRISIELGDKDLDYLNRIKQIKNIEFRIINQNNKNDF